ncbi:MAG: chorismate synthase, partial [Acidimicrobiales bacterium]
MLRFLTAGEPHGRALVVVPATPLAVPGEALRRGGRPPAPARDRPQAAVAQVVGGLPAGLAPTVD